MTKPKINGVKIASIFLSIFIVLGAFALGFAAWSTGQVGTESVETIVSVSADEVQYAGFDNLTSNSTIKFDAPTSDNAGRIVYTNDIGGEQLKVDISGTVLHYSEVGSITISGSFDSDHTSIFTNIVNSHYLVAPTFQELTRKPTVANPTEDGSYWTTDHDTVNDARSFRIIASFGWGSYFNYKNPSIFFDSNDSNGIKMGKEYTNENIKSILSVIRQLSHSIYNVNLSPEALTYTVAFLSSTTPAVSASALPASIVLSAGETFTVPSNSITVTGYTFLGYSLAKDSTTANYLPGETHNINEFIALDSTVNVFNLYTVFEAKEFTLTVKVGSDETGKFSVKRGNTTVVSETTVSASSSKTATVKTGDTVTFSVSGSSGSYTPGSITTSNLSGSSSPYTVTGAGNPSITVANASGGGGGCLLPTDLVTMADGTQKEIQYVQPGEMIAVFNHETGQIDYAPVTFNERDDYRWWNIIHLEFSNGSKAGVATEHGFFDLDTMRYEYIDEYNYQEFVGHRFYAINNDFSSEIVTLVNAYVNREYTDVYELPSFYHLNFIADGILSMPGGIKGLFNIFEYGEDLKYDEEAYNRDIELYGLFTYEDLAPLGVTEIMFEAYAGKYLQVALGKGILTEEYLAYLIERYGGFTEGQEP